MLGSVPSSAATHDPGSTSTSMPRGLLQRQVALPWVLVLALGTGAGSSGLSALASGSDGTRALALVEKQREQDEKRDAKGEKRDDRIKALEDGAALEYLRARERARTQAWMVGTLVGNHAAISAIAKKLDVVVPPLEPLLPQGPDWPDVIDPTP